MSPLDRKPETPRERGAEPHEYEDMSVLKAQIDALYSTCELFELEALLRGVLEGNISRLGGKHPETLFVKNELATALHVRGSSRESEKLYREVLDIRMKTLGEKHPDTLEAQSDLAGILYDLARYDEAKRLYEDIVRIQIEMLGADHSETARHRKYLAWTLDEIEKIKNDVPDDGLLPF